MEKRFAEVILPTLAANLALDEALLQQAEIGTGNEILRFWEWSSPAVVLGAGCPVAKEVNVEACAHDAVPIYRRSSGGGTVLLDKGCLLFSLILSYERSPRLREISSSYRYILHLIRDALSEVLVGVEMAGISDLVVGNRKFSGNSQQRKRKFLLHHGTFLYDFNSSEVERYLYMPQRQPEYRRRRRHEQFLMNVLLPKAEFKGRMVSAWKSLTLLSQWDNRTVQELVDSKYETEEWTFRR